MTLDMFPGEARIEDPNRRYTTAEFMDFIKEKAGVDAWDVDVAADAESHHAPRWFSLLPYAGSAGLDGLVQSWLPSDLGQCMVTLSPSKCVCCAPRMLWRAFVNPPFDDLGSWLAKTWATIKEANNIGIELRIAFVLPGDRNEQHHWQEHVEPFRDGRAQRFGYDLLTFNPAGRIDYAKPGSNGLAVGSAFFPSAVLVWRKA